ncbi:trehalose-phosphatase [Brucella pituitosa]|uniref:trehalose-phosphatase n=1 Tax=Brucella pituitosa TaxID=571256 RepID=UPI0013747CA3|nr:trehalose-phosphatase [Brucella pituitosa]
MSSIEQLAFFLDLDGTLLDLAPTPDGVRVEPDLQTNLQRIAERTHGALAIVTGRSVAFVEAMFPGHQFAVAGLHGAELKLKGQADVRNGADISSDSSDQQSYQAARDDARAAASRFPGVIFEDKGRAFALHYRRALPHAGAVLEIMKQAVITAGAAYSLQAGKFVYELKPGGSSKASAVNFFMQCPEFQGRLAIAAGDDLTDEAMFAEINARGGASIRVGHLTNGNKTCASMVIGSPQLFRNWIGSIGFEDVK